VSKILNILSKIFVGLIALFAVLFSSCSFFKFKTSCDLLGLSTYREVSSGVGVVIEDGLDVTTGELKLFENLEEGSDFISIKVPINLDGSISYTLPVEAGRKDYVLTWQEGNLLQWKDINSVALGGTGEMIQIVEKSDGISENSKQNIVTINTVQTGGSTACTNLICITDRSSIALESEITGILSLKNGGIGASLEDPGEDRILFWDESAGKVRWLKIGDNLDIDDRTLDADDGSSSSSTVPSSGYTGEIYTAGNGLYVSGSEVRVGGSIDENTTLSLGDFDLIYDLNGTGDFLIQDNGNDVLFVADSGNIGIGTTNPLYKLDIYQDNFGWLIGEPHHFWFGVLDDMSTGGVFTGSEEMSYIVEIDSEGTPDTFIWTDDGWLTSTSAVAITGGTQPLSKGVYVSFSNTTGHSDYYETYDRWEFSVTSQPSTTVNLFGVRDWQGNYAFHIDSNGYVGIGTSAPDYELDVLGTIQAYNFINSAGMPVNDILLEEEVRNLSITAMTGSLGLDMSSNFVEKVSATTFNPEGITNNNLSTNTLTNGNILIAYTEDSDPYYSKFVIYDSAGNPVVSETTFNTEYIDNLSTNTLTNGNILIAYTEGSNPHIPKFVIYDSAGNLVVSETTYHEGDTGQPSATTLTNGNILIAYADADNYYYGKFVIYDSAGNLVVSETTFNEDFTYNSIPTTLTNGNILITYNKGNGPYYSKFVIYDSAGNLVKAETTFNGGFPSSAGTATLTNGNILFSYREGSSPYHGKFVIYDSAGNLVKAETTFNAGSTYIPSATTLTNGNILIAYREGSSPYYSKFVIYDSAGNLVVSETTFNTEYIGNLSTNTLTNGNVLIAYVEDSYPGYGKFVIYGPSGASFANMVGIGTTDPTASLHVAGTLRFSNFGAGSLITDSSGNVSVSSDERLKDVQGSFDRGLEEILQLDPILYKWNDTSGMETETTYAGLSAQNVQSVIPEAVDVDSNGYLTLSDRPIMAATINAIKEQQLQIEELKSLITGEGKVLESIEVRESLDIQTTDTGILTQVQTLFIEFKEMIQTLGMTTHTDELGDDYLSIDSDVKMAADLNVLGKTTTSDLTVTGNVQMGLITLDTEENSIDVLGVSCYNEDTGEESEYCSDTMNDPSLSTLYLQKSSSGNLNIFNGKLVIEPNGTTKLDGTLEVSGSVNSKSVDTETVSTEKIILKNSSNENSETPSGEEVPELQAEESLDLSEPCEKGEIKWDDNNIYVCTSSEKWRASPLNDIE